MDTYEFPLNIEVADDPYYGNIETFVLCLPNFDETNNQRILINATEPTCVTIVAEDDEGNPYEIQCCSPQYILL